MLADGSARPAYKKQVIGKYSGVKKTNIDYTD